MLFRKKTTIVIEPITIPTKPTEYPEGTFLSTEAGLWYVYTDSKRMRFISQRVMDSWSPHRVIKTSEAALGHYPNMGRMRLRGGSLIKNITDGKMYLISSNKKRQVTSPDVLTRLNASESDVILCSDEEVNLHEDGVVLN